MRLFGSTPLQLCSYQAKIFYFVSCRNAGSFGGYYCEDLKHENRYDGGQLKLRCFFACEFAAKSLYYDNSSGRLIEHAI